MTRSLVCESRRDSGSPLVLQHLKPRRQRISASPAKLLCISREVKPVCAQLGCPWLASNNANGGVISRVVEPLEPNIVSIDSLRSGVLERQPVDP